MAIISLTPVHREHKMGFLAGGPKAQNQSVSRMTVEGAATSGQTIIGVPGGFTPGFTDVYIGGAVLSQGDYNDSSGAQIVLNKQMAAGTQYRVVAYNATTVINTGSLAIPASILVTPALGATGIPISYTPGFVWLYRNGSKLPPSDFTAIDGANIAFVGFTGDGITQYEVATWSSVTPANCVPASGAIFTGPITFPDGSKQAQAAQGRNRLDNGDARIAQRPGLSLATGAVGYGAADRWKAGNGLAAGTLYTSQTYLTDQNGVQKTCVFQRCDAIFTTPTGGNVLHGFYQAIEGYNINDLIGKQVTVSFIFKSNVAGLYPVALRDAGNTTCCVQTFNYPVANAAQYVALTFPAIPMSWVIPALSGVGLVLNIAAIAGTSQYVAPSTGSWLSGYYLGAAGCVNWGGAVNNQINATDIQLEEGIVATPFERLPYAIQFARCQRCFFTSYPSGSQIGATSMDYNSLAVFTGPTADANSYVGVIQCYPVTMRTYPSVTIYNPKTGAIGTAYAQNAATSLTAVVGNSSPTMTFMTLANQPVAAHDIIKFHCIASADL
jgi:hypothetical protein